MNTKPHCFSVWMSRQPLWLHLHLTSCYGAWIRATRTAERSIDDVRASIVMKFAAFAPMAPVVHSGGNSLHEWFLYTETSEDELHRHINRAVHLGADREAFCHCRQVRMADGKQSRGKRQQTLFGNPQHASAK